MKFSVNPIIVLCVIVFFFLFCFPAPNQTKEEERGTMVIKVAKEIVTVSDSKSIEADRILSGDIVYRIFIQEKTMIFKLNSIGLVSEGIETKMGKSGNISIKLKSETAQTTYDPKQNKIESKFLAEVHYPLIDRIKGYIKQEKEQKEFDVFRSYTENFEGKLICKLHEPPDFEKYEERMIKAEIFFELRLLDKVLGEIVQLSSEFKPAVVYAEFKFIYLLSYVDIQPVFIRYTPPEGCFGGSTTATTGGSFNILRDRAIEMWNRCCLSLNFLSPVYVNNDDYRVLTSAEETALLAEYNDPDAIEVFFVEISDPVGLHGGGACYSSGTANTQIITYDTNLPINLYNLAHELGHAFGLMHPNNPPYNSTAGSLMEPSGFCADNPALMSDKNCDNASNPLISLRIPIRRFCMRDTNM